MSMLKNYRFSIMLLSGVLMGAVVGIYFGPQAKVLQPVADIFLNLIFCLIVPVVFFSVASSIANMDGVGKLKKILLIFLAVVIGSGLVTCMLALGTIKLINPTDGLSIDFGTTAVNTQASLSIVTMLTVSDFSLLLSKNSMLPLIIFTILLGISLSLMGEKANPVKNYLNVMVEAFSRMVAIVMYLAPLGIACYFAVLIGVIGSQVISSVARVTIIYIIFTLLFFVITSSLYAWWGGGNKGLKIYWKYIWLPMTAAMGTCSSTACIPVNMQAAHKMNIPKSIYDIVIPLGGSVHKNGVVAVQIMKVAFLFAVFNRPFGIDAIGMAILVAMISGIIVGTIPSGGFIGEVLIATAFGFPPEVIPVIVIMGTISDSFCTMLNVTSDTAISMVIARMVEGEDWIDRTESDISFQKIDEVRV
ncbi:dicarboxylate/amino acid:cation symporter [Buttiauxella warmboldiae]|uniref:Dicarboxylate/amino acid:cation symporter n=2 Tax=Buttiauxella warmboldiae TaxID=82993 RepID=A0A3N5DM09_9ENTR|nr:dicarboxylate/amino acid:cation symporter [Buttiauxella warmboldiae]